MSQAAHRIVSGTISSWCRIAVTIGTQIAVTPLFLSRWTVEEYGYWLLFIAITALIQIVDVGHQNYVGYECLRAGTDQTERISRIASSALLYSLILGFLTVAAMGAVVAVSSAGGLGADVKRTLFQYGVGWLMIVHSVTWTISGSPIGIVTRMLSCFGYYSRFAWWALALQVFTAVAPGLAVLGGADLLGTGLTLSAVTLIVNIFLGRDALLLCRKHGIRLVDWSWGLGLENLKSSTGLAFASVLDLFRQQGIRLILGPAVGARELASFATLRTGANFANQGLATVTQPMMPEMMRFLRKRDQQRSVMSFAMVWLVVLVLLNPAVIVAELFGKQIFAVWTHGKIPFDFALFAGLSSGILIYALAQPAMAILQGNNLIWLQLAFSALTSTVAVAGIWISIGRFGISGVGVVLAISEFCGLIAYLRAGMRWLAAHDMKWPWRLFAISSTAVLITVVSLYLMAVAVSKDFVAACCLFLQAMFAIAYWRVLPEDAKERIRRILPGRLKWDLRG